MNEHVLKARRLIAAVGLANVRLVETSAKTRIRLADITAEMAPTFSHSAKALKGSADGAFFILASIEVKLASGENPEIVHASMKAQFELEYRLPSDFKASKAEIEAFAKINGVFNAWPYFREFVQSTSQKMDLPVIILPVYRVPQVPRSQTEEQSGPLSKP